MAQGLLEVTGTIDLAQFWPAGESDADTVKVYVASNGGAFRFRPHPGAPSKITTAFENGATVRGKTNKPAVDNQHRITIRLQGIDAPELHYRPVAPTLNGKKIAAKQRSAFNGANGDFRQHLGETATIELHTFLSAVSAGPIACVVRTAVDQPSDVFDTYGRLVGDIFVTIAGKEQNVNHWLAESGWAFPTFYTSMSDQEITDVIGRSEQARSGKRGVWKSASPDLSKFDRTLVYRKHGTPDPKGDRGAEIMPKLFRRQSTFAVAKIGKVIGGALPAYLKAHPDDCYETKDFLSQGSTAATHRRLDEFVSVQSRFTVGPKDLVFQEAASRVVDKNGQPAHW